MTPSYQSEASEYRKAITPDAEQSKKVKQNLTEKCHKEDPIDAQHTRVLQQQYLHFLDFSLPATLQIFWARKQELRGVRPKHVHCHHQEHPQEISPVS